MQVYSVRLSDRVSEIINRNSDEQGITSRSVYIRSLVEKGLVIDAYIQDGKGPNTEKKMSLFEIRLAQILVENLALSREILKNSVKSEVEFNKKLEDFKQTSQEFVMALMKTESL